MSPNHFRITKHLSDSVHKVPLLFHLYRPYTPQILFARAFNAGRSYFDKPFDLFSVFKVIYNQEA